MSHKVNITQHSRQTTISLHAPVYCISYKVIVGTCRSYPPPKVKGAPAAAVVAVAVAVEGGADGVAGVENPNPVLAGADAVVPANICFIL